MPNKWKELLAKNLENKLHFLIEKTRLQIFSTYECCLKITEKSHSTLRAQRTTFTFWVDKSWSKMPKMVTRSWSLRSNSVTRQVNFNRTKIGGKCQNSNVTFWVIFKQCVHLCVKCICILSLTYTCLFLAILWEKDKRHHDT